MFKDINKAMLLKLVALHVVVIIVSNALVAVPVEIMGVKLTWAAFTFPLVVIATDLTVRLLGKSIARQTIAVAYPLAIIGSVAVVLAEGAPGSVALRIGFASATAYAVGTMLDVYVFQILREKFSQWWLAPAVSTVAANLIDTYALLCCCIQQQCRRVHGGKLGRDRRITSGIENTIGSGHLPTGLRITTQTSVY